MVDTSPPVLGSRTSSMDVYVPLSANLTPSLRQCFERFTGQDENYDPQEPILNHGTFEETIAPRSRGIDAGKRDYSVSHTQAITKRTESRNGFHTLLSARPVLSSTSHFGYGVLCFALNPYISRSSRPSVWQLEGWGANDVAVHEIVCFRPGSGLCSIMLDVRIGRRLFRKPPFAIAKALALGDWTNVDLRRLLWTCPTLSVSYPLAKTVSASAAIIVDSDLPSAGCLDIILRKTFSPTSTATFRQTVFPINHSHPQSNGITGFEWVAPLPYNYGTATVTYKLRPTTALCAATLEVPTKYKSKVAATVQVSNRDVTVEASLLSTGSRGGTSLLTRSEFENPADVSVNKTVGGEFSVGLRNVSGAYIVYRCRLALPWVHPSFAFEYGISWHPGKNSYLCLEFGLHHLGSSIELPVMLAWPVQATEFHTPETTTLGSPLARIRQTLTVLPLLGIAVTPILAYQLGTSICHKHPEILNWIPSVYVRVTQPVLTIWSSMKYILRRLDRILKYSGSTAGTFVLDDGARSSNDVAVSSHSSHVSYAVLRLPSMFMVHCVGLKRLIEALQLIMGPKDFCCLERAVVEQQIMESFASACHNTEEKINGLRIIKALYGPAFLIRAQSTPAQLPASAFVTFFNAKSRRQTNFLDSGAYMTPFDVTVPIQAMIRESKLRLGGGHSYNNLPGFFGLLTTQEPCIGSAKDFRLQLYIRYSYGGRESERVFSDGEPVFLP